MASLAELEAKYRKIVARLEKPGNTGLHLYADDPVGYAHKVLKVRHLTPDQEAVLRAVAKPRARVLVPSGNETGKSFVAAIISSWHYDCFYPTLTLTTAPALDQVKDILFRELRRLRRGDPNFSPKATRLQESEDRVCIGYTAKDANSFHGRHDASVLLVFDEAEGISSEFWEAAESFADRWVCFYNPTLASSSAAVEERRGQWEIVRMSAISHPNVIRGLQGDPPLIPNAVTLPKVRSRLAKWATLVRPGEPHDSRDIVLGDTRYRPGPVAEARILGRRPSRPVNAVYDSTVLHAIETNRIEVQHSWPVQIGCDVARFGDDFSTIHVRKGLCSMHHESHNGWDTVQVAERLRELAVKFGAGEASRVPIVVDVVGIGAGVVDIGHRIYGFRYIGLNSSSASPKADEFRMVRDQLYFDFRDLLGEKLVDMTRLDQAYTHDIIEQLQAASYTLDTKARQTVLPKKDIKDKLGRSPDDGDGVLLAYYQFPEHFEIT